MKKVVIRFIAVLCYLAALLGLIKFKFSLLFDWQTILLVLFGTAILTLASIKKKESKNEIIEKIGKNASVAGYLTTFVLLFSRLSSNQEYEHLLLDVALSCRPLLYSLIINALCFEDNKKVREESVNQGENTENSKQLTNQKKSLPIQEKAITKREEEVANYIMQGLSNKEIAEQMYISESTVKKHTSNLYQKLEITNREQLKQSYYADIKLKKEDN